MPSTEQSSGSAPRAARHHAGAGIVVAHRRSRPALIDSRADERDQPFALRRDQSTAPSVQVLFAMVRRFANWVRAQMVIFSAAATAVRGGRRLA